MHIQRCMNVSIAIANDIDGTVRRSGGLKTEMQGFVFWAPNSGAAEEELHVFWREFIKGDLVVVNSSVDHVRFLLLQ